MLQIETVLGVQNVNEIAAVEGVGESLAGIQPSSWLERGLI